MRPALLSRLHTAHLGAVTFWLPVITIHLSFVLSVIEGHIHVCLPYWLDCASISKSGRYGSAYFLFKGGMLPTAILLGLFWIHVREILIKEDQQRHLTLIVLGLTGSAALVVYTLALGHAGDEYRLLRRFGVALFMFCVFINQVHIGAQLLHRTGHQKSGRQLLQLSAVTLLIAMLSLALNISLANYYDRYENMFEWWLIMLLLLHLYRLSRCLS